MGTSDPRLRIQAYAMNILYLSQVDPAERWLPTLTKLLPEDRFFTGDDAFDPSTIDIALVATPKRGVLGQLSNIRLVQSLWMGVDGLLADPTFPRYKPLARLIDPGMVAAMVESVVSHVLDYHRHHYLYRTQQAAKIWKKLPQFLASDRTVGILGLGELGTAVAARLLTFDFKVAGWKRRPGQLPDIQCFYGATGIGEVLSRSQAVICLLPLTDETRGVLNSAAFAKMPKGSCVINVARGPHVVIADLLAALDSGHLAHAYLDVFDAEPLPANSPLWTHPGITLTPHSAALTEPRTAMARVVENIERVRAGKPALNLVDFGAGY
jgi:glyoxylate/hydroxypyruvate reductase